MNKQKSSQFCYDRVACLSPPLSKIVAGILDIGSIHYRYCVGSRLIEYKATIVEGIQSLNIGAVLEHHARVATAVPEAFLGRFFIFSS